MEEGSFGLFQTFPPVTTKKYHDLVALKVLVTDTKSKKLNDLINLPKEIKLGKTGKIL